MLRVAASAVVYAVVLLSGLPAAAQTNSEPPVADEPAPAAEPAAASEASGAPDASRARTATAASRAARVTLRPRPRVRRAVPDARRPEIPADLAPWVAWALHDTPELVCPDVAGARVCRWPGTLRVEADDTGASFSFEVYADRPTAFALPGDKDHWPQDVRLDGAAPAVLTIGDLPHVEVPAGAHRVEGRFAWQAVPEVLAVPMDVGNVDLTLGTRPVPRPRVDDAGRLWLRDGATDAPSETESDSVRASIYRKFQDGVPLTITTRMRLNVSGRAREVELGRLLVDGSRPIAVRAQIPVQVGDDGLTKVYVRPGSHDVEIDAVLARPTQSLVAPTPGPGFYDPQEVWVWVPNETVRSVELDGLTAVDPERTSLPSDWTGFTTYLADPGAALQLQVTRRGVAEAPPNVVRLSRDLWLDLDGEGYTIRDRLSGTLNQGWRLDYGSRGDASLGRVAAAGENLLITDAPESGLSGVELRSSTLDLEAEVRVENARRRLAIVGWDHDVQSLSASLHLPPGWTVLGSAGVDTMRGTWIASWSLWDFFFVLMIAVVIGRLFGWSWAAVALVAMCLAHGEQDAPQWIWIHLIATLALLRVLPQGWWRKGVVLYRWAAIVALVGIMAPFVHDQIVVAFHPQVSAAQPHNAGYHDDFALDGFGRGAGGMLAQQGEMAPAAPMEEPSEGGGEYDEEYGVPAQKMLPEISLRKSTGSWSSADTSVQLQQIDPNAVVQTGPGLPNWSWSTWRLEWTGPVGRDHEISLWLLSPGLNRLIGLIRVALLIVLGLLLLAPRDMYWDRRRPVPRWWRRAFGSGFSIVFVSLFFTGMTPDAYAVEVPDADTQQELRRRVDEATRCPEPCVVASDAAIAVNGLDFEMNAEVSAARDTAWTLPGPADVLRISAVLVDGAPTSQLRRANGSLQVRLRAGSHEVVVVGTLADRNTVTVQFDEATRPRHVTFAATEWAVDGISPTGVPDNSLQLTRTAVADEPAADGAAHAELPPWYQVERRVALGMPWQVYTVVRRADTSRPQLVKIPLLANEKVITDNLRVDAGLALVDFARGQDVVQFVGEIPIGGTVDLRAAEGQPWTETWFVECSRIWRCGFSELPPVALTSDGSWLPQWQPWPGEALTVTVERPAGAQGAPKTVENVRYVVTPGKRLMEADLSFSIRASQGGWQEVTLPTGARLQAVEINGETRNIRPQDGVVRLPVQPGQAGYVLRWQQDWERGITERVPEVRLGSAAANVETTINLGGERWLLAVRNDEMPWGPAVLFWWSLFLVALLASLLSAVPNVPLAWYEWALIALGMSQLPVAAMLPVVLWFVVLAWRERDPVDSWWRFDLVQLGILLLTLMTIGALYGAVHTNLVLDIDMQVDGYGSSNSTLQWYTDRIDDALPTPAIVSVPVLVFRGISFLWALWAVFLVVRSARWGWKAFSSGGWWRFPKPRDHRPSSPPGRPAPVGDGDVDLVEVEVEDIVMEEEPPSPVPRNAVDGELVLTEYDLSRRPGPPEEAAAEAAAPVAAAAEVPLSPETPADLPLSPETPAEVPLSPETLADEQPAPAAGPTAPDGTAAADDAPPEIESSAESGVGDLRTSEVIGALVDDETSEPKLRRDEEE